MFHPIYNIEEGILHVEFRGKVDIVEYLSYLKMLGENSDFPRDLNILNDFRNAEFSFKPTQIPLIGGQLKRYAHLYNTVRIAAVFANPRETAYGQLIEQNSLVKNFTHKIFHTIESANEWLNPAKVKVTV